MGLISLIGLTGLISLMGLIKFKVKITKKGYRVNPYNLFAFKSASLFLPFPLNSLGNRIFPFSFFTIPFSKRQPFFTFLPFYFYLTQFFLKKSSNSLR